jgi:hypothetical protein
MYMVTIYFRDQKQLDSLISASSSWSAIQKVMDSRPESGRLLKLCPVTVITCRKLKGKDDESN